MTSRLRWLDLLRSAAILGMVVYHVAFDLEFFFGHDVGVTTGVWKIVQIGVASLFLVVSGISGGFWTRTPDAAFKGWLRGWKLLSAAMLVSLATAIMDPGTWVRFGILHLIGISAFLLPPLRRWAHPAGIAVLGVACVAVGLYAADVRADTNLFIPLGFAPRYFASVDYVPAFPWLGPLLLGFALGVPLSRRDAAPAKDSRLFDLFAWPGRHSLSIYLLHQPVILGILAAARSVS